MSIVRRDAAGRVATEHCSWSFGYVQHFYYGDSHRESARIEYCNGQYTARIYDGTDQHTSTIFLSVNGRVRICPTTGPEQSWPLADMIALYGQKTPKDLLVHLALG